MLVGAEEARPIFREGDWQDARGFLHSCYRYGVSVVGPVAVSGAHFVASLIFLRLLPPEQFGQFSFLLVIVPFCLSAGTALLGAPAALTRGKDEATAAAEIAILQKASLVVSGLSGIAVSALMLLTHAPWGAALLFGLYGASFTLRGFARSLANVYARLARVAASDIIYGTLLVAGLIGLAAFGRLNVRNAALVFAGAALLSIAPFGPAHFRELVRSARTTTLAGYKPIWREVTRWAFMGVVLTELTMNAHAYFVTFLCGPKAFGLLALGALFMRPASLVLSALPDIDMPLMNRRIAKGDVGGAFQVVKEFRTAAFAVLAAAILLSGVLMIWFPQVVLKKGYDESDVLIVLAFWIAITALRAVRTPDAVFLQAAARYSALARVAAWSGVTSLLATVILLWLAGPIASLGGILLGEVVIVGMIFPLTRVWRRAHA